MTNGGHSLASIRPVICASQHEVEISDWDFRPRLLRAGVRSRGPPTTRVISPRQAGSRYRVPSRQRCHAGISSNFLVNSLPCRWAGEEPQRRGLQGARHAMWRFEEHGGGFAASQRLDGLAAPARLLRDETSKDKRAGGQAAATSACSTAEPGMTSTGIPCRKQWAMTRSPGSRCPGCRAR